MKIVTTAVFSVLLLGATQSMLQWCSIVALVIGICIVQISDADEESTKSHGENEFLGLMCVLTGACTSGFAGVYFEMVLKSTECSIWLRNMQLALIGICFSGITCYVSDGQTIQNQGFFYGYDALVCVVISLAGLGGLLVALVVKYADNILKGFAASGSVVVTSIISSMIFHDSKITVMFVCGATIVCGSSFLYSYKKRPKHELHFASKDEGRVDNESTSLLPSTVAKV